MASQKKPLDRIVQIPETYVVLPLRNAVFFPRQVLPLSVGRESSLRVLEEAQRDNLPILLLTQRDGTVTAPAAADLHTLGTLGKILKVFTLPDGTKSILVQGLARARVLSFLQVEPYIKVVAHQIEDEAATGIEIEALASAIKSVFHKVVELSPELNEEQLSVVLNLGEPGALADIAISMLSGGLEEKQAILETLGVKERLQRAHRFLITTLQGLELGNKIQSDVQEEITKTQREFYLREQLKAINKELGDDADSAETKELRQRAEQAKLPEEVRKTVEKELQRLARMHSSSAESTVARTYIEWLLDLPWLVSTPDNIDIPKARQVLESDHYGLEKVKNRILEYLAVRKLKNDMRGPILCFVGPPGVGKTSLGKSIARALGRKFVRLSLGGVDDEAEIRGHRRTYIGALPGQIIQGIRRADTNDPVFMLDEADKLGRDFRGDPSSALLETLDPEQNNSFRDNCLGVPFDLSKVLFITTANMLDPIPEPLRDRMEIIELQGYTEEEKVHIAFQYLIPRQIEENGITKEQIEFPQEAVSYVVRHYTREAGVRNLERLIGTICRKQARRIAEGKTEKLTVTPEIVLEFLGGNKVRSEGEIAERTKRAGVVVGLAWTPAGGDLLFVEANIMKGKGDLTITGQIQDVMRESMKAAHSWVRSNATQLNIDEDFFSKNDIHIHVPAGAIPKDGPSAGVTIVTALVSLLTGRPVKPLLAMTGEITLSGNVLPIGGVKEKVLAAKRAGVRDVILPAENKTNVEEDLTPEQLEGISVHYVKAIGEVLDIALPHTPKEAREDERKREQVLTEQAAV